MNGWIAFEDDNKMACEFPIKVRIPGLKMEPLYSDNGGLIQEGVDNPDRYGRLFIKSETAKNIEKSRTHFSISGMSDEEADKWFIKNCFFCEDGSDYCDNRPLLHVMIKIEGKDVYLYHDYIMRGTTSDGKDKINVVLVPFSTDPEVYLAERLDDNRKDAIKDLMNWDVYFVCYDDDNEPYLQFAEFKRDG